jgi:hypothetical protein
VATKFLDEMHVAMTGPYDVATMNAEQRATTDLLMVSGTPQEKGALNAIAGKIESHDPSLGLVQGNVERDANGQVTAFTFTNPDQKSAYDSSVSTAMATGESREAAIAGIKPTVLNEEGVLTLSSSGQAQGY